MPPADDRIEREIDRLRERAHDHSNRIAAVELLHQQTARDLKETVAIVKELAQQASTSAAVADRDRAHRGLVLSLPAKVAAFLFAFVLFLSALLHLLNPERF